MFNENCPFRKRKGDCYHQVKSEIRRHEMLKWRGRAINHVHYLRRTELCKGRVVNMEITQIHITGTLVGFTSQYRNVLRHDYYEIAGETKRRDWYSLMGFPSTGVIHRG